MNRRQLLKAGLGAGGSLLLGGCWMDGYGQDVAGATRPLNERIEAWLQSKGPVPEFPRNQVKPEDLLLNSFNGALTTEEAHG